MAAVVYRIILLTRKRNASLPGINTPVSATNPFSEITPHQPENFVVIVTHSDLELPNLQYHIVYLEDGNNSGETIDHHRRVIVNPRGYLNERNSRI